jgi:type IV pilus assembly protein PilX
MKSFSHNLQRQRGFVLITVLMFMVVITIVAIASMRSTKDEIAIAGSRYFRGQAFQQAQSSLILLESCIPTPAKCGFANVPAFDGSVAGFLSAADNKNRSGVNTWISWPNWATAYAGTQKPAVDSLPQVATAKLPKYAVERMPSESLDGSSIADGTNSSRIGLIQPYRVTSRSENPSDGSTVIMQRHFYTLAD